MIGDPDMVYESWGNEHDKVELHDYIVMDTQKHTVWQMSVYMTISDMYWAFVLIAAEKGCEGATRS